MTVVAWDGTRLAADRLGVVGSSQYTVTKVFRTANYLFGISGTQGHGLAVMAWLEAGADPREYPKADKDDASYCVAIDRDGVIWRYEGAPWAIRVEDRLHALGSGRDFAMAAMHLGCNAVEAVGVAAGLSPECGGGVDVVSWDARP